MAVYKLKKTKELSNLEIKKIILIKKRYWKYSFEDHLKWFNNNIKVSDLHFYYIRKNIKMYCCLRLRHCRIKNQNIPFYYLDTLCSLKSHRYRVLNFLAFIMDNTKNKFTITLCDREHLRLYQLFGFKKINHIKITNHNIKNYFFLINIPLKNKFKHYINKNKFSLKI